jgi:hypothetical protein
MHKLPLVIVLSIINLLLSFGVSPALTEEDTSVMPETSTTSTTSTTSSIRISSIRIFNYLEINKDPIMPAITYKWGDCSWLPKLALQAGWQVEKIGKLKQIALRESGCCPNRAGGDKVDKDCNITGVSEWNHRSDSGLLQINGVHWKQDHKEYAGLVCKQMKICTQEPLFDPLTNLKAGKLLYDVAGWSPWTPIKP